MTAMAAISLISFIPHGNFDSYEAASPAACETMLPILGNLCVQHTCFEPFGGLECVVLVPRFSQHCAGICHIVPRKGTSSCLISDFMHDL